MSDLLPWCRRKIWREAHRIKAACWQFVHVATGDHQYAPGLRKEAKRLHYEAYPRMPSYMREDRFMKRHIRIVAMKVRLLERQARKGGGGEGR